MAHSFTPTIRVVRNGVTKNIPNRPVLRSSGIRERLATYKINIDGADNNAYIDAAPFTSGFSVIDDVTAKLESANGETMDAKWDRTANVIRFYGGGPSAQGFVSPADRAALTTELTALMAGVAGPDPIYPVLTVSVRGR